MLFRGCLNVRTILPILQIRQQALIALEEATAVVMIVDGQVGLTVLDEEIARFLRQQKVPVILAVNKCESEVRLKWSNMNIYRIVAPLVLWNGKSLVKEEVSSRILKHGDMH